MSRQVGYLTIVPQAHEGDEAVIVGTPEALRSLALAIEEATSLPLGEPGDIAHTDLLDPGDGEGYRVYVVPVPQPDESEAAPVRPGYHGTGTTRIRLEWQRWYHSQVLPRIRAAKYEKEPQG